MNDELNQLVLTLQRGGVAVLRTDTLYGIVARADDEAAVARVYRLKQRDSNKSSIILVADASQTYADVPTLPSLDTSQPTSILLDSPHAPQWLRRANDMLAYRQPQLPWLQAVLHQTGPLIAPSANLEGQPPARTIAEARAYFGNGVDYYYDGGTVPTDTPPSRLVRVLSDGEVERLR